MCRTTQLQLVFVVSIKQSNNTTLTVAAHLPVQVLICHVMRVCLGGAADCAHVHSFCVLCVCAASVVGVYVYVCIFVRGVGPGCIWLCAPTFSVPYLCRCCLYPSQRMCVRRGGGGICALCLRNSRGECLSACLVACSAVSKLSAPRSCTFASPACLELQLQLVLLIVAT